MTEQVVSVPVADLHPSPSNPRKHGLLKGIEELTESVRSVGILQPVVARKRDDGDTVRRGLKFEVVFGHRRREAAIRAGLDSVPCLVREYDDDQVLEAQIVENLEREDVHPLDEADGFAELLRRGYDLPKIAGKIGKPPSYVAQRLKLCSLSNGCREALDEERITLGVALELAKLPSEKLQTEGLKAVGVDQKARFAEDRGLMTVADARAEIEREVMRKLKNAPFDTTDAKLLPKAGACTTCPKRTGAQVDLFPDASSPDLCSDPSCFREKCDARWKALQKTAKIEGKKLLPAQEAGKIFDRYGNTSRSGLSWDSKYVVLDGTTRNAAGRDVQVRSLFKADEMPDVTVGRNPYNGDVVELVPKSAVERAVAKRSRQHAHEERKAKTPAQKATEAKEKATVERERAKDRARVEVNARCVAAVADAIERAGSKAEAFVLDLVFRELADTTIDGGERLLERRGILPKDKGRKGGARPADMDQVRRESEYSNPAWLRAVLAELVLGNFVEHAYGENKTAIEKACKAWGVDRKKIEATVVAENEAARATAKTEKKAAPAQKPKKASTKKKAARR